MCTHAIDPWYPFLEQRSMNINSSPLVDKESLNMAAQPELNLAEYEYPWDGTVSRHKLWITHQAPCIFLVYKDEGDPAMELHLHDHITFPLLRRDPVNQPARTAT